MGTEARATACRVPHTSVLVLVESFGETEAMAELSG